MTVSNVAKTFRSIKLDASVGQATGHGYSIRGCISCQYGAGHRQIVEGGSKVQVGADVLII